MSAQVITPREVVALRILFVGLRCTFRSDNLHLFTTLSSRRR
jgi:hypothetical protein